ncbi:hypothetical protein, partial [Streptomyces boluensis]
QTMPKRPSRGRTRYVFSYEPLDGTTEPDTSEQDARDLAVSEFLDRTSDLIFHGGPRGMELARLDIATREAVFREASCPDPVKPHWLTPAAPDDDERREQHWAPQPPSPAWAHLAWLVHDLPLLFAFRDYGEGGPELDGIDVPGRAYADVLVRHRGVQWRVRVQLEGRTDELDHAGMHIAETFGDGDYHRLADEHDPHLIDML